MCSTPFGINELFTTFSTQLQLDQPSAQRLSASTNCSQVLWISVGLRLLRAQRLSASTNCSHGSLSRPSTMARVLNAFRHQRTVHRTHFNLEQDKRLPTPFSSIRLCLSRSRCLARAIKIEKGMMLASKQAFCSLNRDPGAEFMRPR